MPVDPRRTIGDLEQLRALTADDHGAQRIAWTETWLKARAWFQAKLAQLPVEHHLDAAGNSWTTLRGDSDRTLILGSHLDSVPNGGWLDGSLGVLASFEVLRSLAEDFKGKPPVVSAEASLVPRHLPGRTRFKPTGAEPTGMAFAWKMLCAGAMST
jgi:N-carbamoyl-L-amino-acid hydrolase